MSQPTQPTPGTVPALADQPPLPWSTVFALLRFRHDNTPSYLRGTEPRLETPVDVDADALRALILFAGRAVGNGDPSVPRQLEAYRVVSLVPHTYGAALFGVATPA